MASNRQSPKHRYIPASGRHDGPVTRYFQDVMEWNRQPGDRLTPRQCTTIVGATLAMVLVIAILAFVFGNFIGIVLEGDPARNG